MTSAWKLPQLGVVNSGGRRSRTFTPKDLRQQPNTDISFNKTPRVAEDAWVRLSDDFSSTFDRKGENERTERRRKACPSQSTHTHVFEVEPRTASKGGAGQRVLSSRSASERRRSAFAVETSYEWFLSERRTPDLDTRPVRRRGIGSCRFRARKGPVRPARHINGCRTDEIAFNKPRWLANTLTSS